MSNKTAIIGGGIIGSGWAARFLLSGWDVTVFDPEPESRRKVGDTLACARRSLPALSDMTVPREGRLAFAATIAEAISGADWVQESVPEQLDIKRAVLAEIQAHASAGAVIASSTSGLRQCDLKQGAARPDQIIVVRPFNPVYLLPAVELAGAPPMLERAKAVLDGLGMMPLFARTGTDAPVVGRLYEAVQAEAASLVKAGIASLEEIDDAIRLGIGLQWAQTGLSESAGPATGEATRFRDDALVSILRALKARNRGVGAILAARDARLKPDLPSEINAPLATLERVIPIDWTDYNGHMNESRYGQVFSDAGDVVMEMIGADAAYIASGLSFFTVDNHITFRNETHAGEAIRVRTQILQAEGKKLRMYHEILRIADGVLLATCNQLLIHVSLETRRSCEPSPAIAARMAVLHAAQVGLPRPESMGN